MTLVLVKLIYITQLLLGNVASFNPRTRRTTQVTQFIHQRKSFTKISAISNGFNNSNANSFNNNLILPSLAVAGVIDTAYLTWLKLSETAPICGSETCVNVLTGPFSTLPFADIPLTAIGLISYCAIVFTSLQTGGSSSSMYGDLTLLLTTAMATFSGYLMFVLTFVLHTSCQFCYASAIISCTMAFITWQSKVVPNTTRAFGLVSTSAMLTFVTSLALFYTINTLYPPPENAQASTAPLAQLLEAESAAKEKRPPIIEKVSTPQAMRVANQLKLLDAKMYGAYWCSHCFNQKNELGIQASKGGYYEYIECDKEGADSQYPLCRSKKIPGYPTWEINGEFYPGEKTVSELETLLTKVTAAIPAATSSVTSTTAAVIP